MPRVSERARPLWLGAAACASGFLLVALLVVSEILDPIDAAIISVVRAPALHDALSPLARITELGSTWAVIVVGALVLLVGWLSGRPRDGTAGALTIAIGSLIVEATKRLTERMRPDFLDPVIQVVGYSFPSGHTTNATVAYGVLGVLVARLTWPTAIRVAIEVALGVIVFGVGLSRVWLGVHYPTDVVAGWLLGGAIVLTYAALTLPALPEPAEGAADGDPAARRSDRPAAG
jgi:undecaprenyl-diphosphatase